MSAERTDRRATLASLTGVLALVDGGFAAIGLLVFNAHRSGHLSAAEAATFTLFGASAAVGAVVMLLAATALARGPRGHGIARVASGVAWLRLAGVIITLVAIATAFGSSAIIGMFETVGAVVAVADAVFALLITGIALRRTRHG
ncbi:hypothetical protein ODJ79_09015 [Actinoplanes sp. KI2]|uniref:hypothetical protein n=1 Tax=Actinoplanes sp. KI2 TaxID=2983315 RepID=UPI0021D5EB1E|nr:hypothetical protein [Actinoplanes sp. KI2]MCU7723852.1 hypothetical protein [Actinoplanes sp. KI2]